jgi:hypothetical protein
VGSTAANCAAQRYRAWIFPQVDFVLGTEVVEKTARDAVSSVRYTSRQYDWGAKPNSIQPPCLRMRTLKN